MPAIHLITYGTPRFWPRIACFGSAAKHFGVCQTFDWWHPKRVLRQGFQTLAPKISLSDPGAGFWAWKPFLIFETLQAVQEGDIVFYCDVGRTFPYKLLTEKPTPFLNWMSANQQVFFPGVQIHQHGPMSRWTKRDAFVLMGLDQPSAHGGPVVQASFSLWKKSPESLRFCEEWRNLCLDRSLVGDDPSSCGLPELPDFCEHRYDQAVLSLLCFKYGVKSLVPPSGLDEAALKHPTLLGQAMEGRAVLSNPRLPLHLRAVVSTCALVESSIRAKVRFRALPPPQNAA